MALSANEVTTERASPNHSAASKYQLEFPFKQKWDFTCVIADSGKASKIRWKDKNWANVMDFRKIPRKIER